MSEAKNNAGPDERTWQGVVERWQAQLVHLQKSEEPNKPRWSYETAKALSKASKRTGVWLEGRPAD